MLRVVSLRVAGAAALLIAATAPAYAADGPPQQAQNAALSHQTSDNAATPAEAAKPKPEEHKICRMVDGSEARLGAHRVCMTAKQWKEADS